METDRSNGQPAKNIELLITNFRLGASITEQVNGLIALGLTPEQIHYGLDLPASLDWSAEDLPVTIVTRLDMLGVFILASWRNDHDAPAIVTELTQERIMPGVEGTTSFLQQIRQHSPSVLVAIYNEFYPPPDTK